MIGKLVGLVAGIGAVGVGYAGLAGQDDTTRDEATGEIVEGGQLGAFRIQIGDCFGDVPDGDIEAVEGVPCSSLHFNEVYDAFMLPFGASDAFPGDPAVSEAAFNGCYDRFEPFVGGPYETSLYEITVMHPTAVSWAEVDDREVLCLINNYDGSMTTGSARGMVSTVPLDQIASCVESTKAGAFVGDVAAQELWNSVGQSEPGLADACAQIGRDDPAGLAATHLAWTAAHPPVPAEPAPVEVAPAEVVAAPVVGEPAG